MVQFNNCICEHDIDMALAQLFYVDSSFYKMFFEEDAELVSVELSKTDS